MTPLSPFDRFSAINTALHEDRFGTAWFRADDKLDSMRSALIIRLIRHLATDAVGSLSYVDIAAPRDYMSAVLARTPYATSDRQLIALTIAAAQMVTRGVGERERLIAAFLTDTSA